MELLIFLHAFLITVTNIFAFTYSFQNVSVVAPFTLPN